MRPPYPVNFPRRDIDPESLYQKEGVEVFDSPAALEINRARLEHLDSLGLPVEGKSVLDVGCGVGHLSQFFVERGCRVVCVDGREENIRSLQWRYPTLDAHVADVEADLSRFGLFDIVFSYGLLYHLENPVAGLRNMAAVCREMLLLETVVCDHSLPVVRLEEEPKIHNQALRGLGCRPSPSFIAIVLNRLGFPFVCAPLEPPRHPDFDVRWRDSLEWQQHGHLIRCIFVASRNEIINRSLAPLHRNPPYAGGRFLQPALLFMSSVRKRGSCLLRNLVSGAKPRLSKLQTPVSRDLEDEDAWQPTQPEILEAARALAYVRPLVPYPGWRFDADWDNPDFSFKMRRRIWSYCRARQWDLPVEMLWHDGLRVYVHLSNDLSKQLFISGCIEPNEFAFLDKILAAGMTFVDAGANEGLYALFAARRVGPSGQVWAFEPSAREFTRLKRNVLLNQLDNVRLFPLALAERDGSADLLVADAGHAGQNTLGGFACQGVKASHQERIDVRRLDDLVAKEDLSRLDVLKADVEGSEVRLFQGAREVLRRLRPFLLFEASEDSLRLQGSSVEVLLSLLRSLGYSICGFDEHTGFPTPAVIQQPGGNLIGVPSERALPQGLSIVQG